MNFRSYLSTTYTNLLGWRTNRKIVVIESDDWGSIRMPSKSVYGKCLKSGYKVDENPYERFDSLESEDDLAVLFNTLRLFKDRNNNYPVFTANCMVANPNFEKIKSSNFSQYFNESIIETFKSYPNHKNSFELWKKGNDEKLFHPQYHGREHLNVSLFMKALTDKNSDVLFGFHNNMPGCISLNPTIKGNKYVEATYYSNQEDKNLKLQIYLDGLTLFEKLMGYKSVSVIPPNYTWSNDFDDPVSQYGVKYFQGSRRMREPGLEAPDFYHSLYLGKKNGYNQLYLVRNCYFEPTLTKQDDSVNNCLKEVGLAFLLNKPAIISSHRLNYIGFIDSQNRSTNIKLLTELLSKIVKKWPTVEFLTSDQLGDVICNS